MISKWMLAAAPLLVALPITHQAQARAIPKPAAQSSPAVTPDQMMRHIKVLASDEYEGRKPGTASQNKTLFYIASQFAALGLEPAGTEGWYQPVEFVERKPITHQIKWTREGVDLGLGADDFILTGREATQSIVDAPVYFVGHGLVMPEAGIDQLAGLDLQGAVVLLWQDTPKGVENAPRYNERVATLMGRGAAAVIGFIVDEKRYANIVAGRLNGTTTLEMLEVPAVSGAASAAILPRLLGKPLDAGADPKTVQPARLDVRVTMNVVSAERHFTSYNVIGRLRGSGKTDENVLYLGHWDHLGICRPEGVADRICNGAVDNASGIAMLIEIARHISRGRRPSRNLLFMGTTAEEMGLLGARYFGAHPVVPADSIVAAINIDTVAVTGKGEPVAILGRGTTRLDPLVDEAARELGRKIDTDGEANAYVQRQDGWYLTKAGIPTVMIGGSFSDMEKLETYLKGIYHTPEDDLNHPIELGGATEDADLMIALGRKLADPKKYQRPRN